MLVNATPIRLRIFVARINSIGYAGDWESTK